MMKTHARPSSIYSADDPLAQAIKPPNSESEDEKRARLQAEQEAKRISDEIDDKIKEERERRKKAGAEVKLLLLGQAESGKSTLQKQFQILYAPATLEAERNAWRAVVYFNVVRNIKRIIQALELGIGPSHRDGSPKESDMDSSSEDASGAGPSSSSSLAVGSPASESSTRHNNVEPDKELLALALSAAARTELATLKLRLSPLVTVESTLADRLSGGVEVTATAKRRGVGVYVRSGWQKRSDGDAAPGSKAAGKRRVVEDNYSNGLNGADHMEDELDKTARLLNNCREDIKTLWHHPFVKFLIEKRKLRLQESAEHFLDSIDRVTGTDYIPSTDDILRVRLQTMGIAQHSFNVQVSGKSVQWHLFDVGGARGQRHTWIPYFDDANAIIFLAPVSAFDQYLEEDPKMNRINDSLQLFTQICSNELLKRVHLVLFLNKTDILKQKLASKISVKKYIPSYADRANVYEPVVEYFRMHFTQVHRKNNEEGRVLYTHFTSVVDTKATQGIIRNVRDSIFRGYLQEASLV